MKHTVYIGGAGRGNQAERKHKHAAGGKDETSEYDKQKMERPLRL